MYKFSFLLFWVLFCLLSCSNNDEPATNTQVITDPGPLLGIPPADDNLSDVDYISLQPAIYNNVLRVQVNYIHKEDDSIVMWSTGEVTCLYTIYKTDSFGSTNKIEEILSDQKVLKNVGQAFYVDTDQFKPGGYYLIESKIDTGFVQLEPSATFFYSKN
jgi:hypothetical protein